LYRLSKQGGDNHRFAAIHKAENMSGMVQNRIKISKPFLSWLRKLGVDPAVVLRHARLPLTLLDGESQMTRSQFFSMWESIGALSNDPALGLKLGDQFQPATLPPSMVAAYYARDLRDALKRCTRFWQCRAAIDMRLSESKNECTVDVEWFHTVQPIPTLLIDALFAMILGMARHGTEQFIAPRRVELKRTPEATGVHSAYFQAPVKFRAKRNALIFDIADLERPFATYNAELLQMLQQHLDRTEQQDKVEVPIIDRVKWILRRILPGGRADVNIVAQELGMSVRTLQRRIVDEGKTFRELLVHVRQELAREYLSQPGIQIDEIAFLLGYKDVASFYRAFRAWEGTTPAIWRTDLINHDIVNRR
jgi:AraC-like DNA-binding protein